MLDPARRRGYPMCPTANTYLIGRADTASRSELGLADGAFIIHNREFFVGKDRELI